MGKDPSFPFYASDWLGSTKRLTMTPAQRGAYIDLLAHQWGDKTCSLEDDDEVLAVLSGLNEGWLKGGSVLLRRCFPAHPTLSGRIANPRLLELRFERDEWREKSRQGGIKSGKVRAVKASEQKTSGDTEGSSNVTKGGSQMVGDCFEPNGNLPSSLPLPSLSTKKPLVFPYDTYAYPGSTDTPEVRKAIVEWLDYRQKSGKPYKQPELQIGKLLKKYPTAQEFIAAVDNSIANGYQGCYPPDGGKSAKQPNRPGRVEAEPGKYDRFDGPPEGGSGIVG